MLFCSYIVLYKLTLQLAIYTLHIGLYTLFFIRSTVHDADYTLHFNTLHLTHCTLHIALTRCSTQIAHGNLQIALNMLQFTLGTLQLTLYTWHFKHFKCCTLNVALYMLHCTIHSIHVIISLFHNGLMQKMSKKCIMIILLKSFNCVNDLTFYEEKLSWKVFRRAPRPGLLVLICFVLDLNIYQKSSSRKLSSTLFSKHVGCSIAAV